MKHAGMNERETGMQTARYDYFYHVNRRISRLKVNIDELKDELNDKIDQIQGKTDQIEGEVDDTRKHVALLEAHYRHISELMEFVQQDSKDPTQSRHRKYASRVASLLK